MLWLWLYYWSWEGLILSTFFEYCVFICCNSNQAPGMLTDTTPSTLGFFSFLGCTYFRKHKSVFLPSYKSPITLFNSFSEGSGTVSNHHITWWDFLRERIWSKIQYEEEMIPSVDALKRHWMRSCWVVSVWKQATENHITCPSLENNGWKKLDSNTLIIY